MTHLEHLEVAPQLEKHLEMTGVLKRLSAGYFFELLHIIA